MAVSSASDPTGVEPRSGTACPTFLVGAERSGTTLTRLMLDCHPRVTWLNEFEYAFDRITDARSWPELRAYREWLRTHRIFLHAGFELDESLEYTDLVKSFVSQWQARTNKPVVGATVHRQFQHVLRIWPDARFIHLTRDPRDVARSRVVRGWNSSVWTAACVWARTEAKWDEVKSVTTDAQRIELRYEDLVNHPERELRRLCRFLGVEFDPRMLDYHRGTRFSPPDPALCEQWRSKLSDLEIRQVESACGDLLEDRGYRDSLLPAWRPNAAQRVSFRVRDRVNAHFFRVRRYGLLLCVLDSLLKRVGPRSSWRRVRLQLNEIDQSHVR